MKKVLSPIDIKELERPQDFAAFQLKLASPEKYFLGLVVRLKT